MITIRISDEAWKKLVIKKEKGETFDEIIDKILKIKKEDKKC